MITKKKNAIFGRYPCCDMVNNAIRMILNGRTDAAVEELYQAIIKAGGYIHADLGEKVDVVHKRVWKERLSRNDQN